MYKIVYNNEIHVCKQHISQFDRLIDFIRNSFRELPQSIKLTYQDNEGDEINLCNDEDLKALNQTQFIKKPKIQIMPLNGIILKSDNLIKSQVLNYNDQISFQNESTQNILKDSSMEFEKKPVKQLDEDTKSFIQSYIDEEVKRQLDERKKNRQNKKKCHYKKFFEQQEKKNSDDVIHHNIICDGCEAVNIRGIRYKCSVCKDFDYCEKCEAKCEHNHPFLKIRDPKTSIESIAVVLRDDQPRSPRRRCPYSNNQNRGSQNHHEQSQQQQQQQQPSRPCQMPKFQEIFSNVIQNSGEILNNFGFQHFIDAFSGNNSQQQQPQQQQQQPQQQQQQQQQQQCQWESFSQIQKNEVPVKMEEEVVKIDDKVTIQEEKIVEKIAKKQPEKVYSFEIIDKAKTLGEFMCQDYKNYLDFIEMNSNLTLEQLFEQVLNFN